MRPGVLPLIPFDRAKTSSLLHGFSREALLQVLPCLRELVLPAGTAVVESGQPCFDVYQVLTGELMVTVEDGDGTPTMVNVLGAGGVAGWSAFIPPNVSTVAVSTLTDCRLIAFHGETLRQALTDHPRDEMRLLENLISVIEERLLDERTRYARVLNHLRRESQTPPEAL